MICYNTPENSEPAHGTPLGRKAEKGLPSPFKAANSIVLFARVSEKTYFHINRSDNKMRSCCKLKNVAVLTTIPFFLALQSHHAGWLHGYYQNPLLSASLYGTAGFATAALLLLLLLNGKTRHSRELLRIINTDPVTGGLSFSKFRSDASKLLQNGKQDYALVYADIQNFKYMNDTYGRSHGDETLKSISEILEASLVQGELAARPYADHFVLLLKAGNADGLMARLTDLWQSASDRISQNQECRILFKTGVSR